MERNKELYEKVRNLAEEVGTNLESVNEDNMSIIIGIADCTKQTATLCVSGVTEGVLEMVRKIVDTIFGEDEDEDERIDENFS